MKYASWMLKPVSSSCNLRCRYCFYRDVAGCRKIENYGRMSEQTLARVVKGIFAGLSDGDDLTIGFQGGEPTLAGLDFYRTLTQLIGRGNPAVHVHYTLQTNGILLDEAWCRFLNENKFLVGLSLDGDCAMHDENRPDAEGKGTHRRVLAAKDLLERYSVPYNILCTLTARNARSPERLWNYVKKLGVRYIQFTPCLGPLDSEKVPWALTPQRFASFYSRLYPLWEADFLNGNYISVKFFDDILNLLLGRGVTACGLTGQCTIQNIVEADGSVYPCDFYVLDEWRLGSAGESPKEDIARAFLSRPHPRRPICDGCPWAKLCCGGCRRMAGTVYPAEGGTFCGYRAFLEACWPSLCRLGEMLKQEK